MNRKRVKGKEEERQNDDGKNGNQKISKTETEKEVTLRTGGIARDRGLNHV